MRRGFTLTEVLVGLFILGLIAMLTLPNINRALTLEEDTHEKVRQILYLKSVMARVKGNMLDNRDPETGVESHEDFSYDYRTEEIEGLKKLTVGVVDDENKRMELEVFLRR